MNSLIEKKKKKKKEKKRNVDDYREMFRKESEDVFDTKPSLSPRPINTNLYKNLHLLLNLISFSTYTRICLSGKLR